MTVRRHPGFGVDVSHVDGASALVARLFGVDSHRYGHMRGAAQHAGEAARILVPEDADLVTAAVWLHDIGYAVPRHGFHSVDGAEYLRDVGWPERLVALVAHHSFASLVAPAAGMTSSLAKYPRETGLVHDLVVYGDMSVDPEGRAVSLEHRLAGIERRHAVGSPVAAVRVQRERLIVAAVARVEAALRGSAGVAVPA
ncbi:MAG: HD domain-containing protein [Actinomycetes bacterium]